MKKPLRLKIIDAANSYTPEEVQELTAAMARSSERPDELLPFPLKPPGSC